MEETQMDQKVKPAEIDLSDLSLQGEQLELNPDADAFATVAPPPDRDENGKVIKYRVKLKHSGDKATYKQGTTGTGTTYIATDIEMSIIDPGGLYDGKRFFDRFVSTMIRRDTKTSRMSGILRAVGNPAPARLTTVELARKFQEVLNGEPECFVEIEWGGSIEMQNDKGEKVYKDVLRGMKRWPKGADGKPLAEAVVDDKGNLSDKGQYDVKARAEVVAYLPVE